MNTSPSPEFMKRFGKSAPESMTKSKSKTTKGSKLMKAFGKNKKK